MATDPTTATTPSDADDLLTFLDDTFSGGHEIRFCATSEPVNDRGRTEERDGATIVWVDEPPSINEFGDSARRHECLSDALRAWYRRDGVSPSKGSAPDTAPRSYQGAWRWNEDKTARLMSAEDWLEAEARVDEMLDSGKDRGGVLRAIAEEMRQIRARLTAQAVPPSAPDTRTVSGDNGQKEWWIRDRVGSWLGPHASRAEAQSQALYYDAHQDSQRMGPHRVVQVDR